MDHGWHMDCISITIALLTSNKHMIEHINWMPQYVYPSWVSAMVLYHISQVAIPQIQFQDKFSWWSVSITEPWAQPKCSCGLGHPMTMCHVISRFVVLIPFHDQVQILSKLDLNRLCVLLLKNQRSRRKSQVRTAPWDTSPAYLST